MDDLCVRKNNFAREYRWFCLGLNQAGERNCELGPDESNLFPALLTPIASMRAWKTSRSGPVPVSGSHLLPADHAFVAFLVFPLSLTVLIFKQHQPIRGRAFL